jgi:hypothetical protein
MASTWSALKIELLETGQNSGTWGTLTNVNLGDAVLGEAITGQATVDFASDADVTITLTDSATTQAARNLRLNITESSTGIGSVRNLILGSGCQIEKFYLINNTGTGAKTVKNTSGTGISVPAGKATLVFNNGTNVVDAASYFSSLTLGAALPVASGGTGLTAGTSGGILGYTATGTLASSVALTANALVLGAGAGATPTPMASLGTTTTVLHGNASGAPTFGAVSLTADVTGVLPTANGGTNLGGATPFTSGGVVYASSSSALATGSALTWSGTNLGVTGAISVNTGAANLNALGLLSGSSGNRIGLSLGRTAQEAYIGIASTSNSIINGDVAGDLDILTTTGNIRLSTNAGASLQATLDTSGNLGLGVTPSAWLSSVTALQVKSAALYSAGNELYLSANEFTNASAANIYKNTGFATLYAQNSGQHRWYNAPSGTAGNTISFTQAMTLDASGNLGIGTTSVNPTGLAILSGGQGKGVLVARNVSGGANPTSGQSLGSYAFKGIMDGVNSNGSSEAMIEAVAAENQSGSTAATNMLFYTKASGTGPGSAPTKRATLTSTGTLGVGNFAPYDTWGNSYVALQVANSGRSLAATGAGSGDLTLAFNAVYDSADNRWEFDGTGDKAGRYSQTGSGDSHVWYVTNTNGTAGAAITFTQAMTLDSNGTLLVGATALSPQTGKFKVVHNTGDQNIATSINSAASSPYGNVISFTGASPNNGTNYFLLCADSTTNRALIYSNGGLANYSANNSNLSDRREKTNFAPATSYLDKICAIPVQTFNYIDQNLEEDGGLTLGVVAQDVQAVAPELVMESNWAKQGDEPKMRLSIYQTDLQYALMKCIQEQQAIIESLKARLDAANL